MKFRLLLILFICFIFSFVSLIHAQHDKQRDSLNYIGQSQLIFKEGKKYTHDYQTYKYEDLENILETHPESFKYYNKALIKKKWSKIATNTLIASSASTAILIWLASRENFNSGAFAQLAITGALTWVVSIILIPISITQYTLKMKYRKRSIQSYNEQEIIEKGYKKDASYLQFGITENGVGLVYNF